MSRLPATMVFAPLGAVGLAIVVNKWARSISRSFMAWQGREVGHPGHDSPRCPFQGRHAVQPDLRSSLPNQGLFELRSSN